MNEDITIISAEQEHISAAGDIAVIAWAAIHEAYIERMGKEMHDEILAGWQDRKRKSVETSLLAGRGYVALVDGIVAGFISYRVNPDNKTGEIMENAVSPDFRGMGIGTKMYEFVLEKMRTEGMKYASVSTGLDDGHAAARRSYEKAGFEKNLPSIKYFMEL